MEVEENVGNEDISESAENLAIPPQNQPSQNQPRASYAAVLQNVASNEKPETTSTNETSQDRKRRLFTIYNLASAKPSEMDIATGLEMALKKKPSDIVQKLQRDTRFRARYNILFKSESDCDYIKTNGFTVAGQKIGGKSYNYKRKLPVTNIYIPNFPATGTAEELTNILSKTNTVTYVRERFSNELGFAIGGWKAGLIRELGKPIPDIISYEFEDFEVIYPGKVRKVRTRDQNWERDSMSSTTFLPKENHHQQQTSTNLIVNKASTNETTLNDSKTQNVSQKSIIVNQPIITKEITSTQNKKDSPRKQSKVKKLKEKFTPTMTISKIDFTKKDKLNQRELELFVDQINFATVEDVSKDLEMSDDSSNSTVHETESVASRPVSDSKMSSPSSRKRNAENEKETEEELVKTKKERTLQWASDQSGGKKT